jgi:hypothetical protein
MKAIVWICEVVLLSVLLSPVTAQSSTPASGQVITFTTNGAWCWFQDERAVVDTAKQKLIVGSTNSGAGVDVVIYDIKAGKVESKKAFNKLEYADDHNAPGLCIAPDGHYVAMWAHHYDKYNTHYSVFDGQQWSAEKTFDWNKIPGGTDYTIAYSNVYYLSDEKRMYDFARANSRAPNFLFSDDNGNTWQFGGQLTTNSSSSYNKGYYKYWGNGKDRIDMVFTEEHPRDQTTSIYHGYITGKKSYSSDGKLADEDIYERQSIPTFSAFTKVFAHGTAVNGVTMGRCWQSDLVRYDNGAVAILFKARANNSETDHRNFYARYDGTTWKTTYIGKAGTKMYADEQDYTGLGALCPDDPNTIYISSPYNPGDDNSSANKREIWKGVTADNGATWKWSAITSNSSQDNFRPIVPAWNKSNTALLWFRGTYTTAQQFNTSIVGMFFKNDVSIAPSTGNSSLEPTIDVISRDSRLHVVTIRCALPKEAVVSAHVYTLEGKEVAVFINDKIAAGNRLFTWNARGIPRGTYLCRVSLGGYCIVKKIALY